MNRLALIEDGNRIYLDQPLLAGERADLHHGGCGVRRLEDLVAYAGDDGTVADVGDVHIKMRHICQGAARRLGRGLRC